MSKDSKKMKAKKFDKELEKLQGELVKMQEWVVDSGAKVCVVFEGRDTAGKGGVIERTPSAPARVSSVMWLCLHRQNGRSHRCISNGICLTCLRPVR